MHSSAPPSAERFIIKIRHTHQHILVHSKNAFLNNSHCYNYNYNYISVPPIAPQKSEAVEVISRTAVEAQLVL